jgi:hypothetical protein
MQGLRVYVPYLRGGEQDLEALTLARDCRDYQGHFRDRRRQIYRVLQKLDQHDQQEAALQ